MTHPSTNKVLYILLSALCILGTLLSACTQAENKALPTPTAIPTPVIPSKPTYNVQRGDVAARVEFTGRIAPAVEEDLYFKLPGRVDQILVKQGEEVKAGQVLAVLETGNRDFDLRRAQIQVEMEELSLQLMQTQTPASTKGYATLVEMKKKELELAQLALEEINQYVVDASLIAPMDGTIRTTKLREDLVVEAFETMMVVADANHLVVTADVSGEVLVELQEGMAVMVLPVTLEGEQLEATVTTLPYPYGSISKDSTDQAVYIQTRRNLKDAGYEIGDLVDVLVELKKAANVLWLPPQAIRTFEGRKFVVVKEDGGQRRVDVRLGLQSEERVEILEGLEEGQVILAP